MSQPTHSRPGNDALERVAGRTTPLPLVGDQGDLDTAPIVEAWRPVLAAMGCPDREPLADDTTQILFWVDRRGDLPAGLPDVLPGMRCTVRVDGLSSETCCFLRVYQGGDAVLLAVLFVGVMVPELWVRLCPDQHDADRLAAEFVDLWRSLGLAVTFASEHATERDPDRKVLPRTLPPHGPGAARTPVSQAAPFGDDGTGRRSA